MLPNIDIDTDLSEMSGKHPSKKAVITSSKSEKPKSKRPKSPPKKRPDSPSKRSEQSPKRSEQSSKRSVQLPSPQQSPTKAHLDAAFSQAAEDEVTQDFYMSNKRCYCQTEAVITMVIYY